MRITQQIAALVVLAGICGVNASAATLSLMPGSTTVAPGASFSIDLVISGLGDSVAPSLGDFDIDIGFDALALDLVGFALGSELGDLGAGEAIDVSFGEFAPGLVNVAEVSFLSDGELVSLQPDAFVLATLDFMITGLGPGESTFLDIVGVLSLGDALGDPIAVDGVSGAMVTAIPVPAALLLFACAIGALSLTSRRNEVSDNRCRAPT